MNYFAIRDDDTSFYTSPDDLDFAYSRYWGVVPISLAVVPFSHSEHRGRSLASKETSSHELAPISENKELVRFLKQKVEAGHVEIMLHGFSHEFKFAGDHFVSECIWKNAKQLLEEIKYGKLYLEDLFDTKVNIFVPPANDVSSKGVRAMRESSLSLSGMMGKWGDRPITISYLSAWIKRWGWRCLKGYPYPYVLSYDGHSELYANALNPFVSQENFLNQLRQAKKDNASFVAATHYWAFRDSEKTADILKASIEEARRLNMHFATVSKCILGEKHAES